MSFPGLQALIRANRNSVLSLQKNQIFNHPKLKVLLSQHLSPFWEERPNKGSMFLLVLQAAVIDDFDFDRVAVNLKGTVCEATKKHNCIAIDASFEVLEESTMADNYADLAITLSKDSHITFFFGTHGIDVCIDGERLQRVNVFYSEEDSRRFREKYTLAEIEDIFAAYQHELSDPSNYGLFFTDLTAINRINPNHHKQILRNSPEKHFRDHLLKYLNQNTQHTFYKEIELQTTKRETDLFTEWEGRKYMIEIKWLGMSIKKDGSAFTQAMSETAARKGVTQSLEYIQELVEKMRINLKCGYLLVFDARERRQAIDYQGFTFIPSALQAYYKHHFQLLPKLNVVNIHPA